jgi:exosortase
VTHPELAQASPATTWSAQPSRVPYLQAGAIAVLLVVAYWTPIRQIELRWRSDPDWSHGYLVPVFSLYFLWTRRHVLSRAIARPNYLGALILAGALALFFAGSWWLRMTYPQTVSIVGAVFGTVLLMGGWAVIRVVWFPIVFLLFAIPLPYEQWVALTRPLQELSCTASALIMPVLLPGLHTDAQSVIIDFLYSFTNAQGELTARLGTLNVEEACSGLRLLMTFLALGTAMAWLDERPSWQRVLMVLSCLPIAVLCNGVRVTVTGLLTITGHDSLATGTPHMLLGIAMVGLAFGLFALFGKVLRHLFVEDSGDSGDAQAASEGTAL